MSSLAVPQRPVKKPKPCLRRPSDRRGSAFERTLAEMREPGKRFVHETECDGEWQCEFL